jgi:hypothetical protein
VSALPLGPFDAHGLAVGPRLDETRPRDHTCDDCLKSVSWRQGAEDPA